MSAPVPSGWDRRRSLLLGKYERIALEMFASRGFKEVTVDEIAEAAEVELIEALEPSQSPMGSVWALIRDLLTQHPPDVELLNLWRRAAADAPEVVARVRGERTQALLDAATAYCARSLGVDAAKDPRPRVLAGIVVGVELAIVESLGRLDSTLAEIVDAAERSIGVLGQLAMTDAS